jgi:hypothetical protein
LASLITGVAKCFVVSKRAVLSEINLKSGFSKFAQDPVVKSANFVPIARAKSVSLDRLLEEP